MEPYKHKVRYYECDRMGITHHSNYIRIMEETRIDFLDRVGYGFEKMEAEGLVSPVISVKCDYRKTTTFQDEIEVEIKVLSMTRLKFSFGYTMRVRGEVVCTAESVHCFLCEGRPVSMADRYPGLYQMLASMIDPK